MSKDTTENCNEKIEISMDKLVDIILEAVNYGIRSERRETEHGCYLRELKSGFIECKDTCKECWLNNKDVLKDICKE